MNELATPMLMMRSFKLCCECDAHTMQIKSTHTHIHTYLELAINGSSSEEEEKKIAEGEHFTENYAAQKREKKK